MRVDIHVLKIQVSTVAVITNPSWQLMTSKQALAQIAID
jgi:hypothetical protein